MDKVNDLASPALAPDATTGDYLRAADPDPFVRAAIARRPDLLADLWRPHAN